MRSDFMAALLTTWISWLLWSQQTCQLRSEGKLTEDAGENRNSRAEEMGCDKGGLWRRGDRSHISPLSSWPTEVTGEKCRWAKTGQGSVGVLVVQSDVLNWHGCTRIYLTTYLTTTSPSGAFRLFRPTGIALREVRIKEGICCSYQQPLV